MSETVSNSNIYPTVIVPGIGQSKTLQYDSNGNVIRQSWPLDIDTEKLKKSLIPSAVRMMLLRNDLGFEKKLHSAICEALDPLKCNPDGSQKNDIRVVSYNYPISECNEEEKHFIKVMVPYHKFTDIVGEENVFYFSYNPYGRAYETVDLLHDYIAMVKQKTGKDKVNLIVISLGGTVSTAYLDKYGSDRDINRVVGIVAAFDGSYLLSDIFNKNIDIDNYEELFITLLGKGDGGKIVRLLKKLPQKLVTRYINTILDAAIETIIINSPMMWGTMPSDEYEKLSKKYISDNAHKALKERTDAAWSVRRDFPGLVSRMKEYGIDIYSLCGYNQSLFAVRSDKITSDTIVHTGSCSMKAELAPIGETLPEDYVQKDLFCSGHSHISPDRAIDASSSPIADTTWFYKNMGHEDCAVCENLLNLAGKLISGDSITDVFSSPEYPQFNVYSK